MKKLTKILVLALSLVLAMTAFTAAWAEEESAMGQPIASTSGHVYMLLTGGAGRVLYSLPVDGAALSQVDSAAQIDDAIAVGDTLYYIRQNGSRFEAVSLNDGGESKTLAVFADNAIAYKLSYYGGDLYCLVDGRLNKIDLVGGTGAVTQISERQMDEYAISDGVVYYVSTDDTKQYTHDSLLNTSGDKKIEQDAGMLYAMMTDGSNDTLILAQGVDSLQVHDGYLYFHNLNDNYVMANSEEEWLEGLLYRLNLSSNDLTPVLSSYDWNYAPTDAGLMVYKSTGIEVGTLTGEDFKTVYTPETYTTMGVSGSSAYVFEHSTNSLTKVALSGTGSDLLYTGAITYDTGSTTTTADTGDTGDTSTDTVVSAPVTGGDTTVTGGDTTVSTTTTYDAPKTSYRQGDAGDEVRAFQTRLVELGYLKTADGIFGAKTKSAVVSFQSRAGLTPDGVVGAATMAALYKSNAPKASGGYIPGTDSSYLIKDSATKYLTEADVKKLDKSMWSFARNEILARHGYQFNTKAYATYFASKSWYKPGGFSWANLNAIENANIQLIKKMEDSIGGSDKSQYIFPTSGYAKLTESQVRAISRDKLGYARNEILARHGYSFTTAKYRNYFNAKSWYKEGGFSWSSLSQVETDNIALIKYVEEHP